jgi:hypothetical protein
MLKLTEEDRQKATTRLKEVAQKMAEKEWATPKDLRVAFDIEGAAWDPQYFFVPKEKAVGSGFAKTWDCCEALGPAKPRPQTLQDRIRYAFGPDAFLIQSVQSDYANKAVAEVDFALSPLNAVHDHATLEFKVVKARATPPDVELDYEYKNRYAEAWKKPIIYIYQVPDRVTGELKTYTSVSKRGNHYPEYKWYQRAEVVMAVDENGNVEVVKNRHGTVGTAEKIKGWDPNADPDAPKKQTTPTEQTNWPKGHSND